MRGYGVPLRAFRQHHDTGNRSESLRNRPGTVQGRVSFLWFRPIRWDSQAFAPKAGE
jgi:hypothetical protein